VRSFRAEPVEMAWTWASKPDKSAESRTIGCVRTDKEIKQTVIAILTCARDGDAGTDAGLLPALSPAETAGLAETAGPAGPQLLTAAAYAMSLFHLLAAEFEAACPDVDVQAFLRRRALELAAEDEEAA
jgi:hypothetical protein